MSKILQQGEKLPPSSWDRSWRTIDDLKPEAWLEYSMATRWREWVVKLNFWQNQLNKDGKWVYGPSSGTGFYINMPCTTHSVIMTAGHNLVGADGQRSERLKILTLDGKSVPIDNDSFKICDDYKEQNPSRKAYDWGAIMLKDSKDIDAEGSGFGFSLSLAVDCEGYEDMVEQVEREKNNPLDKLLKSGNINVSGYRAQDPAATPALSSGHGFVRNTNQLEYAVRTQPGVSGSPVWAAYNRVETVIAIHNYGPEYHGGSKGSRLNMRVLQTVFRWIQVSYMSRTLKVNHPQAFKEGLYLCFPPYVDFGMVRVGNEDLETQFDIIPAEMGPKTSVKNALYAFLFIQPKGWPKEGKLQWVFWDVDKDEATLMPNLHSYCFVYIWKKIKKSAKANSEAFRLLAARGRGSDMTRKEFRMECNMIKKEDFGLGFPLESPETSFVKEKDRLIKFNYFSFE